MAWPCLHYNRIQKNMYCFPLLVYIWALFLFTFIAPIAGAFVFLEKQRRTGEMLCALCYIIYLCIPSHSFYFALFMNCVYCCGKVIYQSIYVCNHQPIIPPSHPSNNSSIHPSTIDSPSCQSIHPSIHHPYTTIVVYKL